MNQIKPDKIVLREGRFEDLNDVYNIESIAFGQEDEANLVLELLKDETARPTISLIAFDGLNPVGHILFSRVYLKNTKNNPLMHILAPLAVIPGYQNRGIGGRLVNRGLELLKSIGCEMVFVLGHEKYYPKYGFIPNAKKFGFAPPYEIAEKNANAWMFQSIGEKNNRHPQGRIKCSHALSNPVYWVEP